MSATAFITATPALAQLRIVTLNTYNGESDIATPRSPWLNTILGAIGSSVSDDPTLAGNTGIAKPIDVLCLQEVYSAGSTVAGVASIMNSIYPGADYRYGTLNGASTGAGTQGIVYNAKAVTLVQSTAVGGSSGAGQPRQALRYQLRPTGYGASADFYVYNSHYKAGDGATDANLPIRRNDEAVAIRANSDALGANKNVIYLGDFNVYHPTEPMYQTLLSAGNGQALDPINKTVDWHNNSAYKNIHTQSPYSSSTAVSLGTGFLIGAAGGMDDRFDQQLITANVNDRHGFAYLPNSYQAFGNNGTTTFNQPINYAGNTAQPQNVLDAMAGVLDHVPVVADYQLPAMQSVAVAPIATQVITGTPLNVNVTVSNAAPVAYAIGADALTYNLTTTGDITGSTVGSDAALGTANTHVITLSTASAGAKSGNIAVDATSESTANGTYSQAVNYTVLDHANGSFSASSDVVTQTIDFGYVPVNSAARTSGFQVHNRAGAFRAALDLDTVSNTGDTARLSTNAAPFTNLPAGFAQNYVSSLNSAATGNFSTVTAMGVSDQNILGGNNRPNLVLTSKARVFSVATFPVTGYMYLPDNEPLTTGPFSIQAGVTLTKTGPGSMTIDGAQSNGAGSQLVMTGGVANFNTDAGPTGPTLGVTVNAAAPDTAGVNFSASQHLASLNLANGNASVTPNGATALVTSALAIAAGSKLDLSNNNLIVRGGIVGTASAGTYTDLSGLIQTGRNGGAAGTTWQGNGIVTTQLAATTSNLDTLGIATASQAKGIAAAQTAIWNGQLVTGSDALVMYTYGGDANLDGKINVDDYTRIDFNAALGTSGWYNGDFNYDGKVNVDDYTIIDFNVGIQGAPLNDAVSFASSVTAIPEPAITLALLPVMLLARRRRRQQLW